MKVTALYRLLSKSVPTPFNIHHTKVLAIYPEAREVHAVPAW